MTAIFVTYTEADSLSVKKIGVELTAQGYIIQHEPTAPSLTHTTLPRTVENALLGSAAVVLIWSQYAAQAPHIEQRLLFAHQLKKPIFPVLLDNTNLPNMLSSVPSITTQADYANVVVALIALPTFPSPHSTDALITLYEQATHDFIRERKAAIDQAAVLLTRSEHHEEVLALLSYLAQNDTIMSVREKAQEVIDAEVQKIAPSIPPAFRPQDAQFIFGVRCKNGHLSYFDKRVVCAAYKPVPRLLDPVGKPLDELHLTCDTCGEEIVAHVDCEGYR